MLDGRGWAVSSRRMEGEVVEKKVTRKSSGCRLFRILQPNSQWALSVWSGVFLGPMGRALWLGKTIRNGSRLQSVAAWLEQYSSTCLYLHHHSPANGVSPHRPRQLTFSVSTEPLPHAFSLSRHC